MINEMKEEEWKWPRKWNWNHTAVTKRIRTFWNRSDQIHKLGKTLEKVEKHQHMIETCTWKHRMSSFAWKRKHITEAPSPWISWCWPFTRSLLLLLLWHSSHLYPVWRVAWSRQFFNQDLQNLMYAQKFKRLNVQTSGGQGVRPMGICMPLGTKAPTPKSARPLGTRAHKWFSHDSCSRRHQGKCIWS